jgi:hypothetical protein
MKKRVIVEYKNKPEPKKKTPTPPVVKKKTDVVRLSPKPYLMKRVVLRQGINRIEGLFTEIYETRWVRLNDVVVDWTYGDQTTEVRFEDLLVDIHGVHMIGIERKESE